MKIGLVTACYHPVVNGVTRMVDSLAAAYVKLGHQAAVFTLGPPHEDDVHRPFPVYRSPGRPLGRSGYFATGRYSNDVARKMSEMDILHAHHPAMCLELIAKLRLNIPLVFTNHTRYDQYLPLYLPVIPKRFASSIGEWLTRRFWPARGNLADHLIAPTPKIKEIMRRYGITRPIAVIPNGIPPLPPAEPIPRERFGWTDDHIVLIAVGRLASEKNPLGLLHLFANALSQNPLCRLLIVGNGPERPHIKREIDHLRLTHAVCLTGEVPFDQVPPYLKTADLFITTSTTEVDPLTVIEAMSLGRPVIALKADWSADCLPPSGQGSWIADSREEFVNQILTAANDTLQRQQAGEISRQFAGAKTIDRTAGETIALYQNVQKK